MKERESFREDSPNRKVSPTWRRPGTPADQPRLPREDPMRLPIYLATSVAVVITSAANAQTPARPAAPQVTVGADLKQLIFEWDPVPAATQYQVLVNATGNSGFVP